MSRRIPPLNALRAFEAAGRHLSFLGAARELHVTPSAVSHQVRHLEDHLGVALFRRLTRRVELTPEARSYLPAVSSALDGIDSATRALARSLEQATVTLSVSPSFATEWLVPRLLGFQAAHPEVELRLVTALRLPDFSSAGVDLAINFGRGDWERVHMDRLVTEELVPVCSPALLAPPTRLHRPEDLARVTLLHVMPRADQWRYWLEAAEVALPDPDRGPKFHNTGLALEAAEAGLGVVIAGRVFAAPHLERGTLVVPFEVELPSRGAYYLAWPEGISLGRGARAFRAWLLEAVAGEALARD